ncbi:MAG: TetR/AcrR family transcriptional regulator [Solirubrobacteraceae bacterium]
MQPVRAADTERTFIETARRAQIVDAAIDTIAELGYARASLGRIAERIGISRGLISYHFAGKDKLITEIVRLVVAEGIAYMQPRILAQPTAAGMLSAYIESNLAYMREHPNRMLAIVEIARDGVTADGRRPVHAHPDVERAVQELANLLASFQAADEMRADFDPHAVAIAIRAAIDAAPSRLRSDPEFDIDGYAREIAGVFDSATRIAG